MASTPSPFSLVFSPNFGAEHFHIGTGEIRYHVDMNLAGAIRVPKIHVNSNGKLTIRKTIEIGRHRDCTIRLGYDRNTGGQAQDEDGYPLFNLWSRKMVTLTWLDSGEYQWVGRSAWFVMAGGVWVNDDGLKEWGLPKNGVWLNGELLRSNDPCPLFQDGADGAKLQLGADGKIIVLDRVLDQFSTGWDASVWIVGWGKPEVIGPPKSPDQDTDRGQKRLEAAESVAQQSQTAQPWQTQTAIAILSPLWDWFKSKGKLEQFLWFLLIGALSALLLWIYVGAH